MRTLTFRQIDAAPKVHYICDNHSSHSAEPFCRVVARIAAWTRPAFPLSTLSPGAVSQ